MSRKKNPDRTQEEVEAHLREFWAPLCETLNEVMQFFELSQMIDIIERDPQDDDVARTGAMQEVRLAEWVGVAWAPSKL